MGDSFDNYWKGYITESSLSRVHQHMMDHDSAIFSAFRGENTEKQNRRRSRELKAQLLQQGYGVTKVDGSYVENFNTPTALEVAEQSLFVSNRYNDPEFFENVAILSDDYAQDSALMIPRGGKEAYLLGTKEENDFPPKGEKISVGDLKMGEEAEFMSRVRGRPFTFDDDATPVLETYEQLSRNARWAVKKLCEAAKKRKNIKKLLLTA
tara:strand:+ start:927 stop:1553 length:627 start_codon:yes stop_codon:yes gene_type:complete